MFDVHRIAGVNSLWFRVDRAGVTTFDHSEWAPGHARTAAVADIILNHHSAVLCAIQGTGWADIQTSGIGAVLANVRAHKPPELRCIGVRWVVHLVFDPHTRRTHFGHPDVL